MVADVMCPNCGEVIDVDDEATEDYYADEPCETCEEENEELEAFYSNEELEPDDGEDTGSNF